MVSSKWVVIVVAGACSVFGAGATAAIQDVTSGSGQPDAEVVSINGNTASDAELTSFAQQLEVSEGQRFASKETVLNEYILTQLADKIPTSATVNVQPVADTPSPYDLVSQRGVLKRELREVIEKTVEVPREDMEKWYDANVSRYIKPERVHALHLFMETSDDEASSTPEKVRSRLAKLKADIDSGTSFSAMAEQHSEAASGQAGGEIGMITRRMPIGPLSKPMNLELENAFFSLPVGEVSDVVETRHGMHLLYVSERETTRTPTVDDLVTSGILPGVLKQDRLTSEIRNVIEQTVQRYNGQPLPNAENEEVTSDTVAYKFDGKDYLLEDLLSLYGPRFSSYLQSAKEEGEMLKNLMTQAMEDEAMVRAAIDKGLANKPEIAMELEALATREKANRRVNAIVEAESQVKPEMVQQRYEQIKDELRQPEAEGAILILSTAETTDTAEQARSREYTRRKAEEIRQSIEADGFEKATKQLSADSELKAEIATVPHHVIGQTTDTQARIFDQAISGITANKGISSVVPVGTNFVIAHLVKRTAGEPIPLEDVRERLESMIRNESQSKVREELVERLEQSESIKYLPGAVDWGKSGDAPSDDKTTTPE